MVGCLGLLTRTMDRTYACLIRRCAAAVRYMRSRSLGTAVYIRADLFCHSTNIRIAVVMVVVTMSIVELYEVPTPDRDTS